MSTTAPSVAAPPIPRIWMDSGAFSAFTLGAVQSLPEYCAWLKRHAQYIDHYAVLDVIGSADGTWDNQRRMEDLGVSPVPCFHYGEDPKWLVKYLERGDKYIALGGMVPISSAQLKPWLDELWSHYLTDARGQPTIAVHGFGLTTFDLMERYPWFSVDSSSWLQSGAFGLILYVSPRGEVSRINVSDKSPKAAAIGQHFRTETTANQAVIKRECEARGFSMQELVDCYWVRHEFNAAAYIEFASMHGGKPWVNPESDLFSMVEVMSKRAAQPASVWPWRSTTMYLAGEYDLDVGQRIYKRGANRMFTYHALKNSPTAQWTAMMAVRDGKGFPSFTPPKRKTT